MIFRKAKLIVAGAAIVAAFAAGFQVASWRADARRARELELHAAAQSAMAAQMAEAHRADQERTHVRESELAALIGAEREQTEALRREIQDRPVIRQVVRVPVAGECPAEPSVDWSVFVDAYNRAATGAAAGAPDAGDAVVPGRAADAIR